MPVPPKIQLALQGGGAKLSALLAAMEAVQTLHRDKKLQVTRVAGTSAGSIAACLFAAGVSLGEVRERLKGYDPTFWKSQFSDSKFSAAYNIARRRPLWSDSFFREQLEYFFDEQGIATFEDIENKTRIKAFVLATNLRESKAETYSEGDVIPKILDSCAIPFCFRVWNKDQSPVIVDGGICENLPSEALVAEEEEFGPVIGISFREDAKLSPNSALQFTFALLNTAMNHSVSRARSILGNDRLFQIKTDITTFGFDYAFSDESDAEYKRIEKESLDYFGALAKGTSQPERVKTVPAQEWTTPYKSMVSLGRIFESHHMGTRIKNISTSLEVTAGSLMDPIEDDYVRHKLTFRTLDVPVQCLGFSINAEHDFSLEETKFEVFKKDTLETVQTELLPSVAPGDSNEKPRKRLIVYFIPELPANSGDYVVILKDVVSDFMLPLRTDKYDSLSITPYLTEEPIDSLTIVLHTPKTTPNVKMIQPENLGHAMSVGELSKFNDHKGFKSSGWKADNVKIEDLGPDTKFKVEIFIGGKS